MTTSPDQSMKYKPSPPYQHQWTRLRNNLPPLSFLPLKNPSLPPIIRTPFGVLHKSMWMFAKSCNSLIPVLWFWIGFLILGGHSSSIIFFTYAYIHITTTQDIEPFWKVSTLNPILLLNNTIFLILAEVHVLVLYVHGIVWSSQQRTVIIFILQMKKLRLREFKYLA